ncbi:MAG: GNAT family N-acetyltransferase [Pseudomonadota bacterium]
MTNPDITLNLNGFTDIPNGKVANIATYLEMTAKPALVPANATGLTLERMDPPVLTRYRAIFHAVGEPWLWFSRLTKSDEWVEAAISRPGIEVFVARHDDDDVGLLELDVREPKNIELAYFGLIERMVGTGASHWLMNEAVNRAFDHHHTDRMFVHTCTMDHPAALNFYMKNGFVAYKRAVEIDDDPRLSGHVRRMAGPHHPVIE